MAKDIFEDFLKLLSDDFQYVSDLRQFVTSKECKKVYKSLFCFKHDRYPINQWEDLIEYLFYKRINFNSSEDAYMYLMNKLANH